MTTRTNLTDAQWEQYERNGYVRLGSLLDATELAAMQNRINDIMLGRADVPYEQLLMQLDSKDGQYENAGPQSKGWKGETLEYRKIQELEYDPLFLAYMQRPIFHAICAHVYGGEDSHRLFSRHVHEQTRTPGNSASLASGQMELS